MIHETTLTEGIDESTTELPAEHSIDRWAVVEFIDPDEPPGREIAWSLGDGKVSRGTGGSPPRPHPKGTIVRVIGFAQPEFSDEPV